MGTWWAMWTGTEKSSPCRLWGDRTGFVVSQRRGPAGRHRSDGHGQQWRVLFRRYALHPVFPGGRGGRMDESLYGFYILSPQKFCQGYSCGYGQPDTPRAGNGRLPNGSQRHEAYGGRGLTDVTVYACISESATEEEYKLAVDLLRKISAS